jgi:hypothetical protein
MLGFFFCFPRSFASGPDILNLTTLMLTKCVIAEVEGVVTASEQPGKQQDQRLAAPRQELNVGQVGQHAHQERVVRACPRSHVTRRELQELLL